MEALLGCAGELCRDRFGHYVMQHLLTHGTAAQVQRLMQFLESEVRGLCSDKYGGAVVSHALSRSAPASQKHGAHGGMLEVARAMRREPGLLTFVACSQHSHVSVPPR